MSFLVIVEVHDGIFFCPVLALMPWLKAPVMLPSPIKSPSLRDLWLTCCLFPGKTPEGGGKVYVQGGCWQKLKTWVLLELGTKDMWHTFVCECPGSNAETSCFVFSFFCVLRQLMACVLTCCPACLPVRPVTQSWGKCSETPPRLSATGPRGGGWASSRKRTQIKQIDAGSCSVEGTHPQM